MRLLCVVLVHHLINLKFLHDRLEPCHLALFLLFYDCFTPVGVSRFPPVVI